MNRLKGILVLAILGTIIVVAVAVVIVAGA